MSAFGCAFLSDLQQMLTQDVTLAGDHAAMSEPAPIHQLFELRIYRAQPGAGGDLVALFEAQFQDAYEAAGARIEASFRVAGASDRWVWIRSFSTPEARGAVLQRFYGSDVWQRYRAACHQLLSRVEGAWLLRPEPSGDKSWQPSRDISAPAEVWTLVLARPGAFAPGPAPSHARVLVSDTAPNSYPRQSVRRTPTKVLLAPGPIAGVIAPRGALHLSLLPQPRSCLR